ncbi:acetyltransferase [Maridesulfovibrio bastinii]|uniref:acetyltransferase n=1 Tax=Maridesulfovibrio bastinii TaxID=47157 RepID=UPI000687FEC0|nr:acetyltransferase [Maridesulfovibrio bastinii]
MIHIFGCGGHSLVVLDTLEALNKTDIVFYDDKVITDPEFEQYKFGGAIADCVPDKINDSFIVAIGNNAIRKNIFLKFSQQMKALNPVHPSAIISKHSSIKQGSVVFAGAIINRKACIEENVIINTGAIIEHECIIGSHTHVAPGSTLCGSVTIGENCLIGANSTILPCLTVGAGSIIGAGSVVTKNVPPNTVVKNSY